MFSKQLLIWASSLAIGALAVPAPGACSGSCGTHDPALIRRASDGTYFRFTTNGHVGIASAPSISGPWTNRGAALGTPKMSYGSDMWAPDVSLVGNTYYMYYAVSSFGSQNSGIGLATSTTLEPGSWTDHGSIGLDSGAGKNYNSIDPNLVKSGNDYYLSLGSFWGDIYQARLNSGLNGPASTPVNIVFEPSGGHAVEGAYVFPNGGYFYVFWSAGQCCNLNGDKPPAGGEYMIKVCRSSSVSGPYTDKNGRSCTNGGGTVVLQSHDNIYAPGGQGVLNDPTYGPVLYYHYMNTNIGISDGQTIFGWNPMSFSGGWPTVLDARVPSSPDPTPTTTPTNPTTPPSGGSGSPLYGQCGGQGWTGPTTCAQGSCKFSNDWYSQCL